MRAAVEADRDGFVRAAVKGYATAIRKLSTYVSLERDDAAKEGVVAKVAQYTARLERLREVLKMREEEEEEEDEDGAEDDADDDDDADADADDDADDDDDDGRQRECKRSG